MKYYYGTVVVVVLIATTPGFYHLLRHIEENQIIDDYLAQNQLADLPVCKESAIRVSNQVRKDFNTNEQEFAHLQMNKRPFLREDVGYLLTYREGLCGEGTRVIVRLLCALGFDATRVTLFDKRLVPAHTLVSVKIDNEEFWIDSINSGDALNRTLQNYNVSSNTFTLVHYNQDITARRMKNDSFDVQPDAVKHAFNKYWLYSYEGLPMTKIMSTLGFDGHILNFKRPESFLAHLGEKPHLILFLFYLLIGVASTYILHRSKILGKLMIAGRSFLVGN
jgi:hypothetical protein